MTPSKIKFLIIYEELCYKRDLMYIFKPENTIFRGGNPIFIEEKRKSIADYRKNKNLIKQYRNQLT